MRKLKVAVTFDMQCGVQEKLFVCVSACSVRVIDMLLFKCVAVIIFDQYTVSSKVDPYSLCGLSFFANIFVQKRL